MEYKLKLAGSKVSAEPEFQDSIFSCKPSSPVGSLKAVTMVLEKPHKVIPPHILAEAISTVLGLDLRWSSPITPSEIQYVKQYIVSKHPQYSNGLIDLNSICSPEEAIMASNPIHSPTDSSSLCFSRNQRITTTKTQLKPSRLLDVLVKKSSFPGNFMSVPEARAQNQVLKHLGLADEDEYAILFTSNCKDAMMLVGESYPFSKYNCYMTAIPVQDDYLIEFSSERDAKVIMVSTSWLDLRVRGSQLSQCFRRKCKHSVYRLFAYPACMGGTTYSTHWVAEAQKNSWHVLLDAREVVVPRDKLWLGLNRPDFVLCMLEYNTHLYQPCKVACLLVRRDAIDTREICK